LIEKNQQNKSTGKSPLSAGIVIGRVTIIKNIGIILEFSHYGELWSTEKIDKTYKTYAEYFPGNLWKSNITYEGT